MLLLVVLSGCTKDASEVAPPDATTGALRGTVVDTAIVPVANATVALQGTNVTTTSGADGSWAIGNLAAGIYLIETSGEGFVPAQSEGRVVVGETATITITLDRVQTTAPFVVQETWEGFIECSTRVGTGGASGSVGLNVCDDVGRQDANHAHEFPDGTPTWFQNELVWESTQVAGSELSLLAGPASCADPKWNRMDGPSPLWFDMDRFELAARGLGTDLGMCSRVFTWTSGDVAHVAGVQLQQSFSSFSHAFYHMEPTEGWLFAVNGAHPTP